jgi:hypothetical protein
MDIDSLKSYLPIIFSGLGLIGIAVAILYKPKNDDLRKTGIEADGIIYTETYDTTFKNPYSFGQMLIQKNIFVRFLTKENKWVTGKCNTGIFYFNLKPFKQGEHVKVFYDKSDSSNFLVATNQSAVLGRIDFDVFAVFFTAYWLYRFFTN